MIKEIPGAEKKDKSDAPPKKFLNIEKDKNDLQNSITILTNLYNIKLNQDAIKGVYLFGCDIEPKAAINIDDFNAVKVMRDARRIPAFRDHLKKYVPNYYISGLVLMGKPITDKKKIKFYLKIKEKDGTKVGEIIDKEKLEESDKNDGKIYKFKLKRKKENLMEMAKSEDVKDSQCISSYLNICLGKILKQCGYTKDRSTRKILYYNRNNAQNAKIINKDYAYFPGLKAVCETYEKGKIFMKLLPKVLLKNNYTYFQYFCDIDITDKNERMKVFKSKVLNKRAIKIYNQALIKIEDVIFENPYKLNFQDKSGHEISVGDYYKQQFDIELENDEIPIAVRKIDRGGKLKGNDIKYIHVPCCFLQIIGNIFEDKINIRNMVQSPQDKYNEIQKIGQLIEKNSKNSDPQELHNYLGDKFDPVTVEGQIIKPPLILFDNNQQVGTKNGSVILEQCSPFSKVKELKQVDIYYLDNLEPDKAQQIWNYLEEASKDLGIKFTKVPNFYPINSMNNESAFYDYLYDYFSKCNEHYKNKEKNETDFIFLFMDVSMRNRFHYRIFKYVINKFDWAIPTQVILYDPQKMKSKNLSKFTNILCQMWAKKGNELYACDFGFIPKTIVVAYSSIICSDGKILTSLAISIGNKLYEYMFYSSREDINNEKDRISSKLKELLRTSLKSIGKHIKKNIENIVIYRDALNERQQDLIKYYEIDEIKKAIIEANDALENKVFTNTKWCLILVSKINEIKMFLGSNHGNNTNYIENIPVGIVVDKIITKTDKYDFYLNSAESRQGTCSSSHYTVLYDDTTLSAMQIYKLTYYLTYLSYNTTRSIRVPAPLYFVTRRNKFTSENLYKDIINPKSRVLNISL